MIDPSFTVTPSSELATMRMMLPSDWFISFEVSMRNVPSTTSAITNCTRLSSIKIEIIRSASGSIVISTHWSSLTKSWLNSGSGRRSVMNRAVPSSAGRVFEKSTTRVESTMIPITTTTCMARLRCVSGASIGPGRRATPMLRVDSCTKSRGNR